MNDWSIKANLVGRHRFLRQGARCVIVLIWHGGGGKRVQVRGLSRGGRQVWTWVDLHLLSRFRPEFVGEDRGLFETKAAAQECARSLEALADAMRAARSAAGKTEAQR